MVESWCRPRGLAPWKLLRICILRSLNLGLILPNNMWMLMHLSCALQYKVTGCMIKICLYPHPALRCFWKDPLMTTLPPPPPHFKHLSLLPCLPSTTPPPLKNFDHTQENPKGPKFSVLKFLIRKKNVYVYIVLAGQYFLNLKGKQFKSHRSVPGSPLHVTTSE